MAKTKSALDRLIDLAAGNNVALGAKDDPAAREWPNLWEWLSRTDAGADHLKDPARLSLALVPGGVQAGLSDATFGVTVDAVSNTLAGVFAALEANLASATPTIRTWRKGEVVLRKKKAKPVEKD